MKEPRSIFFPLALIAAGVIWLLISLQVIPASNLWALTHLAPFFFMALGQVDPHARFWAAGMLVSAPVIGAVVIMRKAGHRSVLGLER
jgi:hypothetical protein